MTSHFRSTPRAIGVTSSPERIRRQWQELQPWLSGMRNEEEAKRQREFEELRLATERRIKTQGSRSETITTIQTDFEKEKKALWEKMKDRVVSRGKQEWAARLQRADLTMDQWTDITIEENRAVAAVMWGVDNEYEDSIIAEESETETESVTPTPSRSSRGPQLWTPPDISKVAELPASNANSAIASSDVQGNSGDSTPAARRSPVLTQSKFGGSAPTPAKAVANEWKAQNKLSEQQAANPQPRVVAPKLQNHARVVPAGVKRELYQDVSSWPEDDATLLPTSHEVTEDERYFDDSDDEDDVSLKAPAYQKVKAHAKWKPPQPDATAQPKVTVQPKTPAPPKISTLPKASTQPKAPNLPNTRTTSNTSVQSNANTEAPRMHPVELAPASLDPNESDLEQQFRKQIEETLRPMYNEAREYEATNDEQIGLMGKIQQIANDLYFVKQYIAIMQASQEKQGKAPSKANPNVGPAVNRGTHPNQTDGPSRSPNTPPSPLTPPVTPNDAKRYIGPILVDEEEDLFDDVALAIRRQKILEFHEAAAVLDISIAEELHQHKGDKRKVNQMLKRRQEEAEELQMKKEKERKDVTAQERKRRRAQIDARAQNGESTERHDPHHRHTKQTPRPSSSQQKARDDPSGWSKDPSYRSQARTGHAGDTRANISNTKRGQTTNGTSAGRTPGLVNRNNPAGSHVLFSMDPVNRQKKGAGTDGPHFGSRQSSRITPLTPTVGLPDIDSDDDEGDDESVTSSLDDDESLASGPNVDEPKHVRFTPSVLADNSTESSERTSTLFNTLGLRPGLDSDASGVYRAIPGGPGSGKGAAGGATMQPTKTAGMGPGWGKEEKIIPEFWIPTSNVTPRW